MRIPCYHVEEHSKDARLACAAVSHPKSIGGIRSLRDEGFAEPEAEPRGGTLLVLAIAADKPPREHHTTTN